VVSLRAGSTALVIFLSILVAGAGPAAASDQVLPVPETGGQGLLRLTSSVYPLDLPPLAPGESFSWQIGVVLDGPASATASMQLMASGSLAAGPGAYRITARSCPVQWRGSSGTNARLSCPGQERAVLAATSFSAAGPIRYPLGSFTASNEPWVLFNLERPAAAVSGAETLKFGIGVVAGGEETSSGSLAETGTHILGLAGAGLVLAGTGTAVLVSRRRRLS
jgi:hypothetical protein